MKQTDYNKNKSHFKNIQEPVKFHTKTKMAEISEKFLVYSIRLIKK